MMKKRSVGWGLPTTICWHFHKIQVKEAGFQLSKVQAGLEPTDWKPFDDVGAGTKEIRVKDASGIYRVMYIAKFEEAIYVLPCFQKKTQ
jgi:phage-related protein